MTRQRRDGLDLLIDGLAVYRITRLVTTDTLTQPIREKLIEGSYQGRAYTLRRAGKPDAWQTLVADDANPPRLAYLVTCPWCSGVWIAAGVTVARAVAPRAWGLVARGAALAAVGALVALGEHLIDLEANG